MIALQYVKKKEKKKIISISKNVDWHPQEVFVLIL